MWSETVSVINLQTLKSMLKSAQKCAIFTFKIQKFSGASRTPPPLCLFGSFPLANTSGSAAASPTPNGPSIGHLTLSLERNWDLGD